MTNEVEITEHTCPACGDAVPERMLCVFCALEALVDEMAES
jgi:hypothetical protein